MKWETPWAIDLRFGMEITMYIANRWATRNATSGPPGAGAIAGTQADAGIMCQSGRRQSAARISLTSEIKRTAMNTTRKTASRPRSFGARSG